MAEKSTLEPSEFLKEALNFEEFDGVSDQQFMMRAESPGGSYPKTDTQTHRWTVGEPEMEAPAQAILLMGNLLVFKRALAHFVLMD